MRADILNPVLQAAVEILRAELGSLPRKGAPSLAMGPYITRDINVMVGIAGRVRGSILVGLDRETALRFAARMMQSEIDDVESLVESGIAELTNCIAGRTISLLSEVGYDTDITPPTVLIGAGSRVSTINIARICVPIATNLGSMDLHVALTG